jgi:hypothetical protein
MNKPELRIDEDGTKRWFLNGKYHREDEPAIEFVNGHKEWCLNGLLHRVDGPAIEWFNETKSWYINGYSFSTKDEWFQALTSEQKYNYLWVL